MTPNPDWSRRDLLKTAAVGGAVLGLGARAVDSVDRYIVGIPGEDDDAVAAASSISDARHDRIQLGDEWTLVEGAYSKGVRQSLLSREDVAFVEPDRVLDHPTAPDSGEPADGQTMPWGVDRVDADVVHDEGATGEGVDVAIVDGGIDPSHPDLQPNLADPDDDDNHQAWAECSGDDCEYPWADDGDHGTHVAGTVAAADDDGGVVGVAPEATLHALKVCGSSGRCRTSDIVEAIKYAADQGWDVVNLSLGSPTPSDAIRAAGEYAMERDVVLVAAAGNRGPCSDCVGYPAAYPEFVGVSATTIDDELAEFSSTGDGVDVAAPGKDVCSGVVGGHGVFSGTSMASPHVAGAAAQLLAAGHSPMEARQALADAAEDVDLDDPEQGGGLLDVAAALEYDSSDDGTGDGTACPT
jgi:subtilisin